MKPKMLFLWIDDDPGRRRFVKFIGSHSVKGLPKAKVEFIGLSNKNPIEIIEPAMF